MILRTKVSTIYECSLERAFKTPMLCDVSKIHTGFGIMPKVTHVTDDEGWGAVGATKNIFTAKSFIQKGGFSSVDRILERNENEYWKIQVDDFQFWVLGFHKFVGEWKTTELENGKVLIEYGYSLHAKGILLYPFNFLFAKIFWRLYMKRVLENIRHLAYSEEPYQYD